MMFGLIFYFMKYRTLQKRFINVENCQDGDEMDAFYGGDMQGGNKRLQLNWDDCLVAFDKKKSPYGLQHRQISTYEVW